MSALEFLSLLCLAYSDGIVLSLPFNPYSPHATHTTLVNFLASLSIVKVDLQIFPLLPRMQFVSL